jgi:phosphoribosylformylglycinamidine synthase subunit PurS
VARVIVDVMLKPEIHDPQGEAVLSAARRLGFGSVTGVRQGKRFELELDGPADTTALATIEELARELLANPVIEEFTLNPAD